MNILQLQEALKDMSKDQLLTEMRKPSGVAPQFLVLSELERRDNMEKRYQTQMPTQTVAEEVVTQGLGGMQQQPVNMPAPQGAPMPMQGAVQPVPKMFVGGLALRGLGALGNYGMKHPFITSASLGIPAFAKLMGDEEIDEEERKRREQEMLEAQEKAYAALAKDDPDGAMAGGKTEKSYLDKYMEQIEKYKDRSSLDKDKALYRAMMEGGAGLATGGIGGLAKGISSGYMGEVDRSMAAQDVYTKSLGTLASAELSASAKAKAAQTVKLADLVKMEENLVEQLQQTFDEDEKQAIQAQLQRIRGLINAKLGMKGTASAGGSIFDRARAQLGS